MNTLSSVTGLLQIKDVNMPGAMEKTAGGKFGVEDEVNFTSSATNSRYFRRNTMNIC
jgi:hypothetical protein